MENKNIKIWEVKGDFATEGIKKMAKRTFQELASNLEELIVNAYDEDATKVDVIINYDNSSIEVIDDGNGMDEESLASYVIYGESNKNADYRSAHFKRAPIGEYGMGGKLAIMNICNDCKIITSKNKKEHTIYVNKDKFIKAKYVSDIVNKVYSKDVEQDKHGTIIIMNNLNYKKYDSERLIERFSNRMPRSQNFKIFVTVVQDKKQTITEIMEPFFEYAEKFEFRDILKLIGKVELSIYYTQEPIPANKQGIWTKVNGRIVNEKQNWFEIEKLSSGHRYKYRIYGISEADGLKNYITFSKNDFIDCPEYREYYNFVKKSLAIVQSNLLKRDEDIKKERNREIVKKAEKEINDVVSKLDNPLILGSLAAKIKKEFTEDIEKAPENPYKDFEEIDKKAREVANIIKRGKDKRTRRNQGISKSEKLSHSGKDYTINTVDLSEEGNLVIFTPGKNLIEINENHKLFTKASKSGYLNEFIRDLAFTEISNDYSEGNLIIFDQVFNQLYKIASKEKLL